MTETVKGFKDFTGEEAQKRADVRRIIEGAFERYGFEPAETPIIEYENFVKGENKQDEAVSDIFRLQDKGKRNLALRYEFTFQLKRLMQNKKLPYRRYQIGPVFRDEPVSSNRLRQFVQCDVDVVGSTIKEEAEILSLSNEILNKLGIKPVILINNRKILEAVAKDIIGIEEKRIKKAITILDKLDKKSRKDVREEFEKEFSGFGGNITLLINTLMSDFKQLKEYYKGIVCTNRKQKYEDTLFYKGEKELEDLQDYCNLYSINIEILPSLARGLSYYNGNVFEIKTKGIKETIIAGGSYKFNNVQCTGVAFGLDRIALLSKINNKSEKYLVVSLDQNKKAIELSKKLRSKNKITSIYYGKPSKALDYANSYKIDKVIFIGKEEVKKRKYKIKDMKSGKERFEKF